MQFRFKSLFNLLMLFILVFLFGVTPARAAGICYVNAAAGGGNTGLSWADAYTSLQAALADTCTEIWVAAGTYKPHASNRAVSFTLQNGVAVYGGFAGGETDFGSRNPTVNITILSGDLSGNDSGFTNNGENSYHVVTGVTGSTLDGFTVSGGNANDAAYPHNSGGGMWNSLANPTVTNVTFSGNAANYGGGMENDSSSPVLTNVIFSGNSAAASGGGMYNLTGSPALTNVTFKANSSPWGGGMYNYSSSSPSLTNVTFSGSSADYAGGMANIASSNPSLKNVTFSGNSATFQGGGMYNANSSPTLKNVIIANSASGGDCYNLTSSINGSSSNNLIEDASNACGLTNGSNGNIIGSDPLLGPLANNGGSTLTFALLPGSPAFNAGTNTGCPVTDQRGVARPQDGTCDIGAYEKTLNPTFTDVPYSYWSWQYIERLYNDGITGGCNAVPLNYCPANSVTRAQMAIFLLRGMHGSAYTPPSATGTMFADVSTGTFGAAWIEELANEGITSGCGGGNFCPNTIVTRAQMAVFLVKARHGIAFVPPTATGIFSDVPVGSFGANFIEQLVTDGITSGCGGGLYCPSATVKRDSMSVFLVKNFNLP